MLHTTIYANVVASIDESDNICMTDWHTVVIRVYIINRLRHCYDKSL